MQNACSLSLLSCLSSLLLLCNSVAAAFLAASICYCCFVAIRRSLFVRCLLLLLLSLMLCFASLLSCWMSPIAAFLTLFVAASICCCCLVAIRCYLLVAICCFACCSLLLGCYLLLCLSFINASLLFDRCSHVGCRLLLPF
jgi:hypothetical protein